MSSKLLTLMLYAVAMVSGIALCIAVMRDAYAMAWGHALLLAALLTVAAAKFARCFRFTSGCIAWSFSGISPSKKSQTQEDCKADYRPRLFLVASGTTVICYFLGVSVIDLRESCWRSSCRNNLKTIGIALLNYEQAEGSFPPAYIADENGRALHSWRTLLLPYLDKEAEELYKKYDFNEPWDGPNNRKLIEKIPSVYSCPEDECLGCIKCHPGKTSYAAITGGRDAWQETRPMTLDDLRGNYSRTAWVAEIDDSIIAWTEPRDLPLDVIDKGTYTFSGVKNAAKHRIPQGFFSRDTAGGVHVLRTDGSVLFLPAEQLASASLGETLSVGGCSNEFHGCWKSTGVNWWNCGVLLVFVGSVYLLLRRSAKDYIAYHSRDTTARESNEHSIADQAPRT